MDERVMIINADASSPSASRTIGVGSATKAQKPNKDNKHRKLATPLPDDDPSHQHFPLYIDFLEGNIDLFSICKIQRPGVPYAIRRLCVICLHCCSVLIATPRLRLKSMKLQWHMSKVCIKIRKSHVVIGASFQHRSAVRRAVLHH